MILVDPYTAFPFFICCPASWLLSIICHLCEQLLGLGACRQPRVSSGWPLTGLPERPLLAAVVQ